MLYLRYADMKLKLKSHNNKKVFYAVCNGKKIVLCEWLTIVHQLVRCNWFDNGSIGLSIGVCVMNLNWFDRRFNDTKFRFYNVINWIGVNRFGGGGGVFDGVNMLVSKLG